MRDGIDIAASHPNNWRVNMIPAEEFDSKVLRTGAEGETAPETLRPMDRWKMTLWKAIFRLAREIHRRR